MRKLRKIHIHQEGLHFLIIGAALLLLLNAAVYSLTFAFFHLRLLFYIFAVVSTAGYLVLVNFFSCPLRRFPGETTENLVVAPADGKIVVIEETDENSYFHDRRLMVSIFMNLFNVHANWYPVDGRVKKVEHQNGRYLKAFLPKASTDNERSMVVIETPDGQEILVRQIAGAVARRIVTYSKEGSECYIDEFLGFIKLGSRVDLYLPLGTEICVTMGQHTTGNQTVIAKLHNHA